MHTHNLSLIARLNESSRGYRDPVTAIPWDSLDSSRPWMPETLLSPYGDPSFAALSDEEKRKLSQYEYLAFIELGLWLESLFMQRISKNALEQSSRSLQNYEYQLHELREEVGHSLMFLEFIKRSGLPLTTPSQHRPKLANWFARFAPYQSAAFWITILIGEEVPDRLNRLIRQDKTLPAAIQAMTQLHIREEARHMAYARTLLAEKIPALSKSSRFTLSLLLKQVIKQFVETCFYPSPSLYAQVGLKEPHHWAALARKIPQRNALVQECLEPSLAFLHEHGLRLR